MSIIGIERTPDGHSGSSIDQSAERDYFRNYWVYSDSTLDNEYFIRSNLPSDPIDGQRLRLTAPYQYDVAAKLRRISVERGPKASWDGRPGNERNVGTRWNARCEWGIINPVEAADSGNPYDTRPEVTIDGVALQKPLEMDANGNPVMNSAFDYFDPPPMTDSQNHVIKIARNEPKVPLPLIVGNALCINMGQWFAFPDSSVKVEPFQTQILYSQFLGDVYFRISYTFTYTPGPNGWKRFILDRGFRGLNAQNKLVDLYDTNGMPLQDAVLLDGRGHALPYPVDPSAIVQIQFQEFLQINFDSVFNFPSNIFG